VQWDGAAGLLDAATGGIPWSAGLLAFFKSNTQGLIQLILLGLYFEMLGISKSKDEERKEADVTRDLLQRALASSSNNALLQLSLQDRYGKEAAEQFLENTFKPCPVLRNMTVKIAARNSKDGYEVTVSLTYSKDGDDFFVAVADDPLHCEALIATGVLSEVLVGPKTDPELVPATVRKRVKDARSGSPVYHEVEFVALSTAAKRKLFKETSLREVVEKLRVFEGCTPTLRNAFEGPASFEIQHSTWQSADYPFMFWLSDRVLEIDLIEIDFRELTSSQQAGARIHLFMSSLQWSKDIRPDNAIWRFPLRAWLLPGQGLGVIWPPMDASNIAEGVH
jgi:hypothetical protein